MAPIELKPAESTLLYAVMLEMKAFPEVDFENVAKRVGIKYGKNARQSFNKVWTKIQASKGETGGEDSEAPAEGSDDNNMVVPPKKPAAKRAPAAKKGVGKATGPKKAGEGSAKPKRKTKKQKDEEAAAAALAAAEADEEEMEEEVEDGKLLTTPLDHLSVTQPAAAQQYMMAPQAPVMSGELAEVSRSGSSVSDPESVTYIEVPPPMNDEYEAYVRGIPLRDWLAAKENDKIKITDIVL